MNPLLKHALVPVATSVMLLAGCNTAQVPAITATSVPTASTPPTSAAPSPAGVIKDSGFGRRDNYAWVTAIVHNNTDTVGQYVTVHFDLADEQGNLIASEDQTGMFDRPNGDIAVGTQVEVPKNAKIASVTTNLAVGEEPDESIGPFPAITSSKRSVGSTYGYPYARFILHNPTSQPISNAQVEVVCYSKQNKVIGGGDSYPDLMPAKRSIVVKSDVITSGRPDHCAAYVGAPSDWEGSAEDSTTAETSSSSAGSDDASAVGAAEAFHTWVDQYADGNWSGQYATLVAAQQSVITEQQYVACRQGDEKTPFAWIKEISTKAESGDPIPGTSAKLDAIVVKARLKFGGIATSVDAHMYLEEGSWHWAMSKGNIKNCLG